LDDGEYDAIEVTVRTNERIVRSIADGIPGCSPPDGSMEEDVPVDQLLQLRCPGVSIVDSAKEAIKVAV